MNEGKDTSEVHLILVHKSRTIARDRKIIMRKRSKLRKKLRDDHPIRQNLQNELDLLKEQLRTSHLDELYREEQRTVDAIKSTCKYFLKFSRAN